MKIRTTIQHDSEWLSAHEPHIARSRIEQKVSVNEVLLAEEEGKQAGLAIVLQWVYSAIQDLRVHIKEGLMSNSNRTTRPFAYIMIVEADDAVRDLIQKTVRAPNCAVDLARDEDEAVAKALQHRPQLIIVKEHSPLHVDELHPPSVSAASRICRRARLSRSVRVVTHSDASITLRWHNWPSVRTFPDYLCIIARPVFGTQQWRKEWYSYSNGDVTPEFLSKHLPFWLGVAHPAPSLSLIRMPGSLLPWTQPGGICLN